MLNIRRYNFWFIGTVVVACGLLLLFLDDELNRAAFSWANGLSAGSSDGFWSAVTVMGDTLIVLSLLLPAIRVRPELVWSVMIAAVITSLLVHGLKELIDMPRPPGVYDPGSIYLIGYVAGSASFPSGHTAAIFTLVGAVFYLFENQQIKGLLLVLAIMVGVSRMVVGIHWPMDVAGGALLGVTSGFVGALLATRLPWGLSLKAQRIQAGIVILAAVLTLTLHDGGYPQARYFMILLPLVLLMWSSRNIVQLFTGPSRTL